MSPALRAIIAWFENLTPQTLEDISRVYGRHCHFQDPFNSVRGQEATRRIYAHMFATSQNPRFRIDSVIEDEEARSAALFWTFECGIDGRPILVAGMSRLRLDGEGRIEDHVDYWDSADLFEHFPVLRGALRWLKRRVAVPQR